MCSRAIEEFGLTRPPSISSADNLRSFPITGSKTCRRCKRSSKSTARFRAFRFLVPEPNKRHAFTKNHKNQRAIEARHGLTLKKLRTEASSQCSRSSRRTSGPISPPVSSRIDGASSCSRRSPAFVSPAPPAGASPAGARRGRGMVALRGSRNAERKRRDATEGEVAKMIF